MTNFTNDQRAEIDSIITGRILDLLDAMIERGQIPPGRQVPAPGFAQAVQSAGSPPPPRLAIVTTLKPTDPPKAS